MEAALILFTLVCIPTLTIVTGITISSVARRFLDFKRQELELRRWEAQARLEQARLGAGMPWWIDPEDTREVQAWRSATAEIRGLKWPALVAD